MEAINPRDQKKILYVEDTDDSRLLVRRLLSTEYVFLEASNPIDGIELAINTNPDLILLDINLPDMSGREVATRLKRELPDTPIVAVTADVTTNARERALVAGCVGFMTKPINIDTFREEVKAFLNGKRETLENPDRHMKAYHEELVEQLERKVHELTKMADQNKFLDEQNKHVIADMQRQQRLLQAAASVGHNITSILDLHELLQTTVNIICKEYEFYYAGIFLIDEAEEWAVLRAGYGDAGDQMIANHHRLPLNGDSMIGSSIRERKGRISLDVGGEEKHFKNPYLPETRSEMGLPLIAKGETLGALTVQSDKFNAFGDTDIAALQSMADQLAIALRNAQLLQELESANKEILRTKTFEAIATATGEAIHWVGNKAAPIPGSADRVREDLINFMAIFKSLLDLSPDKRDTHPYANIARQAFEMLSALDINLEEKADSLSKIAAEQLPLTIDIESSLEDIGIIKQSAETILNIKEDLIGPGRLSKPDSFDIPMLLGSTISGMGYPSGVVTLEYSDKDLSEAWGDKQQIERVLINLIKNAWEASNKGNQTKIQISAHATDDPGFVRVEVKDNGPGIPVEIQEKIWVSFFTTKGNRGGTGLGLSACMEIITQNNGKIWVESKVGQGATFILLLPTSKQ